MSINMYCESFRKFVQLFPRENRARSLYANEAGRLGIVRRRHAVFLYTVAAAAAG